MVNVPNAGEKNLLTSLLAGLYAAGNRLYAELFQDSLSPDENSDWAAFSPVLAGFRGYARVELTQAGWGVVGDDAGTNPRAQTIHSTLATFTYSSVASGTTSESIGGLVVYAEDTSSNRLLLWYDDFSPAETMGADGDVIIRQIRMKLFGPEGE